MRLKENRILLNTVPRRNGKWVVILLGKGILTNYHGGIVEKKKKRKGKKGPKLVDALRGEGTQELKNEREAGGAEDSDVRTRLMRTQSDHV